jgi:hypothetical protein
LQISDDVGETTGSSKHYQSKIPLDPAEKQTMSEEVQPDGCQYSAEIINDLPKKRRKRKKKHGNKGRIPWNKGRKHTAGKCISNNSLQGLIKLINPVVLTSFIL